MALLSQDRTAAEACFAPADGALNHANRVLSKLFRQTLTLAVMVAVSSAKARWFSIGALVLAADYQAAAW